MKNRLIIFISFITLFASCSDDFGGMNRDTKNPTITTPEYLFTNAQKSMVDQVTSTSVNFNVFRLFAQQWTEVQYPQETQYDLTGRTIPDRHWATYYRDVLRDFKEAKSLLLTQKKNFTGSPEEAIVLDNKIAIIDILSSYSFSILVDTFGDIPYSEALDIETYPQPKYDDAQTIYKDLIAVLTAASHKLDQNANSYDEADLIYGGNTAKWAKFANSLRFRLAINIDDADHTYGSAQAIAAQQDGLILDSADGAYMPYANNTTNNNPLYLDLVASGRDDFLPANTFVNKMNALADPRRPKFFTEFPAGSGQYKGGVYGVVNVYGGYSHLTETIKDPVYPGVLFTYSEVEFLLAEAVERGIAVGGTAESHYNAAITASLQDWGVTTGEIASYLASPDVAYTTATGSWRQKIGEQAWIAYFNRGFEAWTSYRRLDFPALLPPASTFGDITEVPKRYSYPGIEQTLNAVNLEAAVAKLGNNAVTTKLFWDKY